MTTDRNDPKLREIIKEGPLKGQQADYLVLSEDERAKGFVRPVRQRYVHRRCGVVTQMGLALAETYARDPKFYGLTFCVGCGAHLPLQRPTGACACGHPRMAHEAGKVIACVAEGCECSGFNPVYEPAFLWEPDGEPVGSTAEEAAEWNAKKRQREAEKHAGHGI